MNVLIGCEESQAVTIEFRKLGHEAFSCDLKPCSGGHPEWHFMGDVMDYLYGFYKCKCGNLHEETLGKYGCCGVSKLFLWDLVIVFPPCTDLAVSGAAWFEKKRLSGEQQKSIDFFMKFANYPGRIAIENPVGIMSSIWRKPDQIIEPYYFGDEANKKTCLWLKGLPKLKHLPKNHSKGSDYIQSPSGRRYPEWCFKTGAGCGEIRSKTYPGIAKQMAEQWSNFLIRNRNKPYKESIIGQQKTLF